MFLLYLWQYLIPFRKTIFLLIQTQMNNQVTYIKLWLDSKMILFYFLSYIFYSCIMKWNPDIPDIPELGDKEEDEADITTQIAEAPSANIQVATMADLDKELSSTLSFSQVRFSTLSIYCLSKITSNQLVHSTSSITVYKENFLNNIMKIK